MSTPKPPSPIYPISFVMNKWLVVESQYPPKTDYAHWCKHDGSELTVGLAPYFKNATAPIFPQLLHMTATDYRSKLDVKHYTRMLQPSRMGGSNVDKVIRMLHEAQNGYKQWLTSNHTAHPPQFIGVFDSSAGTIGINLPFETLVSAIAMAQQGKVVRVIYDADHPDNPPKLSVAAPTMPIKRHISFTKPRL